MEWRGPAWLTLVILAFIAILAQLASNTHPPYVVATTLAFVFVGILLFKVDGFFSGIARYARPYFGRGWHKLTEVTKPVPEREWFNIYQALQTLRAEQQMPEPLGVQGIAGYGNYDDEEEFHPGSYAVSLADLIRNNAKVETLQYRTLTTNASRPLRIAENAMFLLQTDVVPPRSPFVCSLRSGRLAVAAMSEDVAHRAIQLIEQKAQQDSMYRGNVLTCKAERKREFRIEFVESPKVNREQLILPPHVLEILDRNVLQVIKHAEDLRSSQRNLQHGVLLYGPPGTGKSLAVHYLMNAAKPITVVSVTGRQLRLIRESCRLARLLAPSLVVLEDIDLIATDRAQSRRTMLLHDLLDEMDVASTELPVIFLLTTNRPEVIEQALSLRPGRINQAIHFPLPDDDCRHRLLKHFLHGVDASELDLQAMLARSHGASPAFIEEWVRRATLFAISRDSGKSERAARVTVTPDDVDLAIREIVELGGTLTRKLLGHIATA